ncbi:MAG: alpha/beta fold hydrolase [Archangiaceae bacterium]|nr:alpha/beta fold hydrolase [Archangiaceae bacterium]
MRLVWVAVLIACGCTGPGLVGLEDEPGQVVGVAPARYGERKMAVQKHGPPYPVVMAHGFFGFDAFAGVDQLTYFYGVRDDLARRGEKQVFTPAVDPFNDSATRGAQLFAAVQRVLDETGAAKVIIIGHSQGGLDARVVAHEHPDLVAAVVTVATPHRGSPVGDLGSRAVSDPDARAAVDSLVRFIGGALWSTSQKETSLFTALGQFSVAGIVPFNARYTDAPGVPYLSVAGRSGLKSGRGVCDAADRPPFISKWDSTLDPVNSGLQPTELYLEKNWLDPEPNDGLVTVSSARWGEFLGCVPADHLDEIGQLFGQSPGLFNDWSHRDFYASLIALLRARGL